MNKYMKDLLLVALLTGLLVPTTACDEFLDVMNPNELEAEGIDPEKDARLLGQSVWQMWVSDIGDFSIYSAWFTGTAWVGDTFPTRNEFGRRFIPWENGHINTFWSNTGDQLYFARSTIQSIEAAGPTLDLVRAWFVSGEAIRLLAETFCVGTIADFTQSPPEPGPPMSTNDLLDAAIADLEMAKSVAQQVTGDDAEAAQDIAMAAQVHIARAYLQKGETSQASAAAAQVPADFLFEIWHLDDSSNRALGNDVWSFSEARISLVVPPDLRDIADGGDPRIAYVDEDRVSQDGVLWFYRQDKYEGWGDNERWASGLEARYIKVEADGNPADMLAFINERRAVGNQDPIPATQDMGVLMTELMEQKTRDFWLESTMRMADFRRQGQYLNYVIPTGEATYYKPELGVVGNQTCWPVPRDECERNANFEGTQWCIG